MKCAGPFLLAVTLLLAAIARSQPSAGAADAATPGAVASGQPYASIVTRNMFGLVPIPVVDPNASLPPVDPPPKITPNGIMTIFGKLKALYKVAAKPKQGQPPKEDSYVLSEGERQDEIEVVKIDQPNGIVTFNNHGVIQELSLASPDNTTPATSAPSALPGGMPPAPSFNPGMPGGLTPQERNAMRRRSLGGMPNNNGGNPGGGPAFGGGAANTPSASSIPQQDFTPEQQVILIEAQRAKFLDEGNPAASILPPTPLTPQVTGGNGGPPTP